MSNKGQKKRRVGMPAFEILEEATGLLRANPGVVIIHALAAVPFWLGLLYFIADMSRDGYAMDHIGGASLQVALLFIWMKCWQSVAAGRLRASLKMEPAPEWNAVRICRMVMRQAFYHPVGLLVRPVATVFTLPYAWVSSFYQNVTVLDEGGTETGRGLFGRAIAQASLWTSQQHAIIGVLTGFGFFIWINVTAGMVFVPWALKTTLGIETVFSQGWEAYLNSTFAVATLAMTCLVLEPIWQTAYVLRCFYGASVTTGEDLAVEIKRLRMAATRVALCAMVWLACSAPANAADAAAPADPPRRSVAGPVGSPAASPSVDSVALENRIKEVLQEREFAWRTPRQAVHEEKGGWMSEWAKSVIETIEGFFKKLWGYGERLVKWITDKMFNSRQGRHGEASVADVRDTVRLLLWSLAGLVTVIVVVLLVRWLRGKRVAPVVAVEPVVMPDLMADDVRADALPEDEWLKLARQYAAEGQFRLALRAGWLASLAHLGQNDLVRIASYKSNREYLEELRRRARTRETLLGAFAENFRLFERAWYGSHEVTISGFEEFTANLEVIRKC